MSIMFHLLLLATVASATKVYEWKLPTIHFGKVTTKMTPNLNKSLADEPELFVKCYKEKFRRNPDELTYNYNKEPYGRKKRDVYGGYVKLYKDEIPFMISADFSLCTQRRLAIAFRKLEELTCLQFVPYEGEGKHSANVLMIHNIRNSYSTKDCNGNYGQNAIYQSNLDGQTIPWVGSMSILEGCESAFEHEMMHVLGFIHAQDSPFREGPQGFWDKMGIPVPSRKNDPIIQIAPWERNSASSYISTTNGYVFTDWDIWKINKVYSCKTTTYGKKPIDMNNTPPAVKNDFSF